MAASLDTQRIVIGQMHHIADRYNFEEHCFLKPPLISKKEIIPPLLFERQGEKKAEDVI